MGAFGAFPFGTNVFGAGAVTPTPTPTPPPHGKGRPTFKKK